MPGKILMNLAMLALFGLAAVMLVPAALGYHRYVILTGSMTGTYDAGSIIFDKPVPTSELKVGDSITYEPPPGMSPNQRLVTHRIHEILPGPNGQRAYVTKGDANPRPDPWKFTLNQATQDKVVFSIPHLGHVFTFLSVREFRTALIGLPALLIAGWMVLGMWRDGGNEVRRRREGLKPWGADVARRLPRLAAVAVSDISSAASTRLDVTWPVPPRTRTRAPRGFTSPLVRGSRRRSHEAGTVPLPVSSRDREATRQDRRTALPADWKLVVDPRA